MENEKNVEVTPNEATAQKEQVETTDNAAEAENASGQRKVYKTKAEVVERIKEIAHAEEIPQKDEVDYLKTVFYKLHFAEREADMKAYLDAGGDPAAYQVKPDENENAFKAEMTIIKERRAKQFEEQEKLKQENLKKKLDIIEKSRIWQPRRRKPTSHTRNSNSSSRNGRKSRWCLLKTPTSFGETISSTWNSSTTC